MAHKAFFLNDGEKTRAVELLRRVEEIGGVVIVVDLWLYEIPNPDDFTTEELKLRHDSELCLMYAAMMRAKHHLFITGTDINSQRAFLDAVK